MSRVPASNEFAEVWAVPIAERLVALWTVLPQSFEAVSIDIADPSATLWIRRRIIGPRHRIHLFIYRLQDVRRLSDCTLSCRENKGEALRHAAIKPRLPEWRSPGASAAFRALVAALDEEGQGEPVAGLFQALATLSSWSVPCLYHGVEDGLSVAVFSFVPSAAGDIVVLSPSAGDVHERRVVAVEFDAESTCLLWEGEDLDRAYVDVDGELLELRVGQVRGTRAQAPSAWFTALGGDIQDRVLDGWSRLAGAGEGQGPFLPQLPTRRAFALGASGLDIGGVFAAGRTAFLCAETSGDPPGRIDLAIRGEEPVAMRPTAVTARDNGSGSVRIYEAPLPRPLPAPASGSVTLARGTVTRSTWVAIQGLGDVSARRGFHHWIAWETADEGVVTAYADAIVAAGAPPSVVSPPATISLLGSRGEGPLIVTAYDGDDIALRSTLLAVGLGVTGATVRIVHRGRLSSSRQIALRALCEGFNVHVELAMCDLREPVGWAFAQGPRDRTRPTILFCQCGTVPTEVGWWDRVERAVRLGPTAVHWCSPSGADALRPAADAVQSGAPLVAAGPRVDPALLVPRCDVFTLAGFIGQVLAGAETAGHLRALESLRLTRFVGDPGQMEALGDLRIDGAVLAAIAKARQAERGVGAAEPRLLVVGRPPRRQRAAS